MEILYWSVIELNHFYLSPFGLSCYKYQLIKLFWKWNGSKCPTSLGRAVKNEKLFDWGMRRPPPQLILNRMVSDHSAEFWSVTSGSAVCCYQNWDVSVYTTMGDDDKYRPKRSWVWVSISPCKILISIEFVTSSTYVLMVQRVTLH